MLSSLAHRNHGWGCCTTPLSISGCTFSVTACLGLLCINAYVAIQSPRISVLDLVIFCLHFISFVLMGFHRPLVGFDGFGILNSY